MGKTLHGHRSKRGSGHHNNRKNDVITPSASPAQPATAAIAATTPALTTDDCLAACSISTSPGCRDGVGNRRLSLSRGNGTTGVGSSKVAQVSYQFAHPLSESLRSVDLATLARGVRDWRSLAGVRPNDELEERIVDRLIQLEKLQLQTIDQERAARRLRFVAAPTPSGATSSADRGQQQQQQQRCIRVPSASFGGGGATTSLTNRRNDCRPSSPSATTADSSTAENQSPNGNDANQTCRLCNGHHSDTAQCDSSVGSNFVYVSRSLRSQIVDSLLQNSNNNNNNNNNINNGGNPRERPPPQNPSAVNGGGGGGVGTRITSSVANRSRSPSAGPNFSQVSVVPAVRTSTFNCLTVPCLQLPPATSRGDRFASAVDRRSPTSIETQSANYRLSTAGPRNRVREQFQLTTAGISTGSGYGGIVGSLTVSSSSPALTTAGNGSSAGFNTTSAGNLTRFDAMLVAAAATGGGNGKHCLSAPTSTDYLPTSPAVSPSASDRDLVHDFKLLGVRLSLQQSSSSAAVGSTSDKDGSGCDFGNQPEYQHSDVASEKTAVLPAVGTTGSSFLPPSMAPHQRLRQNQSQHRRSADGCGTGGSFPLYRKTSLSIHPASDFGHSSSGMTSSLSERSNRPSTARYLRLHCSGRAACWTACCLCIKPT